MVRQQAAFKPECQTELNALFLKDHRRLRNPFLWTADDLKVVGSPFGNLSTWVGLASGSGLQPDLRTSGTSDAPTSDSSYRFKVDSAELARKLATVTETIRKLHCVESLLHKYYKRKKNKRKKSDSTELYIWGIRNPRRIECATFVPRPTGENKSCTAALPSIGYCDYHRINFQRSKNEQAWDKKKWSEDPYILFQLFSIAQQEERGKHKEPDEQHNERERLQTKPKNPRPSSYRARLLMSNSWDRDFIYLFQADIPRKVLEKLGMPGFLTEQMARTVVERAKIPYQPYNNFEQRLRIAISGAWTRPAEPVVNDSRMYEHQRKKRQREDPEVGPKSKARRVANLQPLGLSRSGRLQGVVESGLLTP